MKASTECENCTNGKKGCFSKFDEMWERVKRKLHKKLEVGDAVTVRMPKKIRNAKRKEKPYTEHAGYAAHYVPKCKGWAVYISAKKKFFFVSEDDLIYEPSRPALDPEELNVYAGPFPKHEILVEMSPELDNFVDSLQFGKAIAEFPKTKQFLMRLKQFDGSRWKDGYEMVTEKRIFAVPDKKVKRLEMAQRVLVQDPKDIGFWRATVVHRLGDGIAVQYDNANCGEEIFLVQPDWIYEI